VRYPWEDGFGQHGSMPAHDEKAAARRSVRGRRSARPEAARAAAEQALADRVVDLVDGEWPDEPVGVTAYLALPAEPCLDAAIAALREHGHRVWVPRIVAPDLEWVRYSPGDQVVPGPLGIREPLGPAATDEELASARLVLLPGLAADRTGRRLGQGGGYYDRFLATRAPASSGGPLRAIVLFEDDVLDEVPAEGHDQQVDIIVTPERIIRVSSATS